MITPSGLCRGLYHEGVKIEVLKVGKENQVRRRNDSRYMLDVM